VPPAGDAAVPQTPAALGQQSLESLLAALLEHPSAVAGQLLEELLDSPTAPQYQQQQAQCQQEAGGTVAVGGAGSAAPSGGGGGRPANSRGPVTTGLAVQQEGGNEAHQPCWVVQTGGPDSDS
jgi:hypothetical protein